MRILTIICLVFVGIVVWALSIGQWHPSLSDATTAELAAWASIYGFAISSAGLLFSAYAAWGVRQIRIRFLAKARLPELSKKLQKDASSLSDLAAVSPVPQQEKTQIFSSLNANLDAVKRHLPRSVKRHQKKAKKLLRELVQQAEMPRPTGYLSQLAAFWPLYQSVLTLKAEIDHHLADGKWEN